MVQTVFTEYTLKKLLGTKRKVETKPTEHTHMHTHTHVYDFSCCKYLHPHPVRKTSQNVQSRPILQKTDTKCPINPDKETFIAKV